MATDKPLVNRVAASGLMTIKLEEYFPKETIIAFDLKGYLYMELMLKEKDFREALKTHKWSQYEGQILCVFCSTDAIIPIWAYMLVASYAAPHAKDVFQGTSEQYYQKAFEQLIAQMDLALYEDQRVVIKGCSDLPVPLSAYVDLTSRLRIVAKSIMFGEPCSTVPIFKKPRPKK